MQQFFELPSSLELSSDLEWMLQSSQADDTMLAIALIREFHPALAGLFNVVLEDPSAVESCLEQTFAAAVARRHTYRAEVGVRNWFYAHALRVFRIYRRQIRIQRWRKKVVDFFQKPEPALLAPGPDAIWIETFQHMGEENRLLISLHLGIGLTSAELAKIYKRSEEVVQGLLTANLTYLLFLARKIAGQGKYSQQIEHFREHLSTALQNTRATHSLVDSEIYALATRISSPDIQQPRRAMAHSFREIALGGAVVVVAVCVWFFAGILDGSMGTPLSTEAANLKPSPTARATRTSRPTTTPSPTGASSPTPESSPSPTVALIGVAKHDLQRDFSLLKQPSVVLTDPFGVNASGSTAVSLVLQSWGWRGDANRPREILQPNDSDHALLPYEILEYVHQKTEYKALLRLDGDIGLMCALVEAGYPVIVERGITLNQLHSATPEAVLKADAILLDDGGKVQITDAITHSITNTNSVANTYEWYTTYEVLTGCNQPKTDVEIWRPSPAGMARYIVTAWEFDRGWWALGNLYLLIYPEKSTAEVLAILAGKNQEYARDNSGEYQNLINAVETTSYRVYSASSFIERFYAWFNRGTALTYLDDYSWAATAFDTAFEVYQQIPEDERPGRIMWYNTRPYWAYFYTERYQDVIDLATITLETPGGDVLEESYYWRALAREALGDLPGALADMQKAVDLNQWFAPAIEQLARMKK